MLSGVYYHYFLGCGLLAFASIASMIIDMFWTTYKYDGLISARKFKKFIEEYCSKKNGGFDWSENKEMDTVSYTKGLPRINKIPTTPPVKPPKSEPCSSVKVCENCKCAENN